MPDSLRDFRDPQLRSEDADLAEMEKTLRAKLGPNASWLDDVRAGVDMERFMDHPAAAGMARQCLDKIQIAFDTFLAANTEDLDSKEVRRAHHDARVAVEVLSMIRETIDKARESEVLLRGTGNGEEA